MLMTILVMLFSLIGGITCGVIFYPFFERILNKLDLD